MPIPVHNTFVPVDSRKEQAPVPISSPFPQDQSRNRRDRGITQRDSRDSFRTSSRLGRDGKQTFHRQDVPNARGFNGSIGRHEAHSKSLQSEARLAPSFEQKGTSHPRAIQSDVHVDTQPRGLNRVVWGEEPLVIERASKQGPGGPKVLYAPAYTPPAEPPHKQSDFPWGAAIFTGLFGVQEAVAFAMSRSKNPKIAQRGNLLGAAGPVEVGLACGAYSLYQQATQTPIEAPKPTDTAKPPEATDVDQELTKAFLEGNHTPLADWQAFNVNGAPWIYHEQRFEEDGHGGLNVFRPVDNYYSGIAFGSRTYWALGAPVAPGVVEATEMQFYMMYTQRSSTAPVEVGMLITTNPNQIKEDYVIADIFHLSDDKLLVKDPNIQVKIQRNSENQIMFTLIRYGTEFPLTTMNSSATTPTPIDSTIYNVKYLQHDDPGMFAFGGEVSPGSSTEFQLETLGLSEELITALEKHSGLEASITPEAGGGFSTSVTVLNAEGQPVTQRMEVTPATMVEDLTTKNKYGDTPVMLTADGKKLYWIQEEHGWFAVELSADINKPVYVPIEKIEAATRVVITEFNEPFSDAALARWKKTPGLSLSFQYLITNFNTNAGTKVAYLRSRAMRDLDLTLAERTMIPLDVWFYTLTPDKTRFELFPNQVIDPLDQNNPQAKDWKLAWAAVGQEILRDEKERALFENSLNETKGNQPRSELILVVAADEGFFDSTSGLYTIGAQPSLKKLLKLPGNDFKKLNNPNTPGLTFAYWVDQALQSLSPDRLLRDLAMIDEDPNPQEGFLPDEFQTIILPGLIVRR